MKVVLRDVMLASRSLTDMAGVYDDIIGKLQGIENGSSDVFEPGKGVDTEWSNVINAFWQVCADSQNNLNDTSRTLVRYINEVCAQDSSAAQELSEQVAEYNDNIFNDLDINDDGVISSDERTRAGYTQEEFDELDVNGDGQISREEQQADQKHPPLQTPNENGDAIDEPEYEQAAPPNPPEGS